MTLDHLFLVLGLLFIGCVICSRLSGRFNMPTLIIFLCIGIGLRILLNLQSFYPMSDILIDVPILHNQVPIWSIANGIGTAALIFILFSGGLETAWMAVRPIIKTGIILSSIGVFLTAIMLGCFTYAIVNGIMHIHLNMMWCMLLGAIISSTDASAVFSILRSRGTSLNSNLQNILEFESGSNDPMAAFLTIFILDAIKDNAELFSLRSLIIFPSFFLRMGVGILVGIAIGKVAIQLFNKVRLEYDGLYYVMGLGICLLAYSATQCLYGNGFMAVYIAGITMGEQRFIFKNSFTKFSAAISWLMQVILFTMLGILASPELVWKFMGAGITLGLFLMLVARPASCMLCTIYNPKLSAKAKYLLSWVGLRGGAPIMLATFPMLTSAENIQIGEYIIPANQMIFHIVFVMVLLSVIIQGMTIMPLAKFLHLDAPLKTAPTSPISFDMTAGTNAISSPNDDGELDFSGTFTKTFTISKDSILIGISLAKANLPKGTFVLTIRRGNRYIIPKGNSILQPHDELNILGNNETLNACTKFF